MIAKQIRQNTYQTSEHEPVRWIRVLADVKAKVQSATDNQSGDGPEDGVDDDNGRSMALVACGLCWWWKS